MERAYHSSPCPPRRSTDRVAVSPATCPTHLPTRYDVVFGEQGDLATNLPPDSVRPATGSTRNAQPAATGRVKSHNSPADARRGKRRSASGEPSGESGGAPHPVFHEGITCMICRRGPIKGIRYKCSVCPTIDFCESYVAAAVRARCGCACPQCLARACTATGVSLAPRTTTTSDTCCSESRTPACPTRRRRPCACPCQRPARRPGQRQCVVTTRWRRSVPRHKPAPDRPRLAAVHSAARAAANLLMGPSSAPAAAKHARRGAHHRRRRSKIFQLSSF